MKTQPDRTFSLLARIVEISNSNIHVENRLKHICDFLSKESGAECVCIYRRDRRGEDLFPWVSSCMGIEECGQLEFRIRPGEGVAGKAALRRVPVFFKDVRREPPPLAVPEELREFASILSVPIMDDVYLYGAVNFSSRAPADYGEKELRFFRIVATEIAGAVRNSRLYHDARKRVSELITLNEIGRNITSTFELQDSLEYVAKTTSRLLQSDGCTIRLAAPGRRILKVAVDEGYARPGLRREVRAHGALLARQIFREKRPLLINSTEDSPLFFALGKHGVTSFLGIPIVSRGDAVGVISYYSCHPQVAFDMEVVHLIQTVCSQLANMIENAKMYGEARALAQENQAKVQRLSALYNVARALMSTVKTERLLQVMLLGLVSPDGLDFSRAILFLLSPDGRTLTARIGMGPREGPKERRALTLPIDVEGNGETISEPGPERALLWPDIDRLSIPVRDSGCLVAEAVRTRKPVRTVRGCGQAPPGGNAGDFCANHPPSFAVVPLVLKGEARGAIYVDNLFEDREILDEDIQILTMFASEASLALENASLYESLEGALSTLRSTQGRLVQTEKLAALGEMAAKIAHEIKNPLTVIGGFAARIVRKEGDAAEDPLEAARYAEIILNEVQRLERIVHQTLYFSRDVIPIVREVDLVAEIRKVLGAFRDELEKSGIATVTRLADDIPAIWVDPDQLRSVLWNLLSNAVQAMDTGGTLTVSARRASPDEGDGAVFEVGDTGGGVAHDVVHNIFNPFFTTKSKGTGLGLPIVHAIVEKHGGTIHLDNREGEGINFSIFLPRLSREPKPSDRILSQMRKGGGDGPAAKNHPG